MLNHNNNSFTSISNSLVDLTVGEILELYKHDTDLLKHILVAKAEEDKKRGAEELRRAEEARLQSKFIDLQLDQSRRSSSVLDDTSLGFSSTDWLPYQTTTGANSSNDLISPFLNNTPPSPSQLPLSPYTQFEVPFANLNLSTPSSPECHSEKKKENKVSCKRTFSRTKSTRKTSVKALSKKNKSSETVEPEKPPLNHTTVMEALRAKLQRSNQQQQKEKKQEIPSMSPSGILLLDLKNPKRTFPIRAPRTSLVKKPTSFISAHKPKE